MRFFTPAVYLAAVSLLAFPVSAQTIQINQQNKTVAISATDEATAVADIAAVTVGFEVFGPDSESAYKKGGDLSHSILEALHGAGIQNNAMESADQSLQRDTHFDEKATPEEHAQRQFVMRQSWTVSVDPAHAGNMIRLAIAAGANSTGNIDWRLSDRKALQAKAAANALVKARAIAQQMADGLHVKLGSLIYASNETPSTRIYFARPQGQAGFGEGYGYGGGRYAPKELPILEIRPQILREEATVYAVFAIE